MKQPLLECCVDSLESALAAEAGGADRLELCGSLMIGGVTPSMSLLELVRERTNIRVNVLLRPRFGDFCYTEGEMEQLRRDVIQCRERGADGVVVGILCPDGTLDTQRMAVLREAAGEMKMTLHRAFDLCADPFAALEQCEQLGVDTILTSGQKNTALEGSALLAQLVERAARTGKVDILVGSGVKSQNLPQLIRTTRATSYHMSGKITLQSAMTFRREGVNMGLPLLSEYDIWRTDQEEVARAAAIVHHIQLDA